MRLVTLFMIVLLSSCSSLWPWGKSPRTGNCLDDDSCENTNPLDEKLVGGKWYCYGENRDTWSCDQQPDETRIISFSAPADASPAKQPITTRAEVTLHDEISSSPADTPAPIPVSAQALFDAADSSFAIQLIALQTLDEVMAFVDRYDLVNPHWVRIRNQDSDWFVVLLDILPTLEEAQRIADTWAEGNNPGSKPWVRPVGPLKEAAMSAARQDG